LVNVSAKTAGASSKGKDRTEIENILEIQSKAVSECGDWFSLGYSLKERMLLRSKRILTARAAGEGV